MGFVIAVVVVGWFEVFVMIGLVDVFCVVGLGVGGSDDVEHEEVNVQKRQTAMPRKPRSTRPRDIRNTIWIRLNLKLRL